MTPVRSVEKTARIQSWVKLSDGELFWYYGFFSCIKKKKFRQMDWVQVRKALSLSLQMKGM